MYYKKIIVFAAALSFTGCISIKNKIGEVKDNQFVVTANVENLRKTWNQLLVDNHIKGTLSTFEIRKDLDTNEQPKEYYLLTSVSSNDSVKVSTLILKKSNRFYFPDLKAQKVIICHGTKDCTPKIFKHDSWGCDCAIESLFDCKKASVVIIHE